MTAPACSTDSVTDLEEQLDREIPCDVDAVGQARGDGAEHGPARWLVIAEPCTTRQHTRLACPICDQCAALVRTWIADPRRVACPKCGARGKTSDFLALKEL